MGGDLNDVSSFSKDSMNLFSRHVKLFQWILKSFRLAINDKIYQSVAYTKNQTNNQLRENNGVCCLWRTILRTIYKRGIGTKRRWHF